MHSPCQAAPWAGRGRLLVSARYLPVESGAGRARSCCLPHCASAREICSLFWCLTSSAALSAAWLGQLSVLGGWSGLHSSDQHFLGDRREVRAGATAGCGWVLESHRDAAAGSFCWLCGVLMEADTGERSRWHPLLALYYLMVQAVSKS